MSKQLTVDEILEKWGWKFLPYSPNEYQWMKFDANGDLIAQEGDELWTKDVYAATNAIP